MELDDRLAFIPRFEVCLPDSVISECIESAVLFLGYARASKEQFEAIHNFVLGRDVFVSLPTGSGKSLCYAALPLVFDNIRKHGECITDHAQAEVVPHSIVVCLSLLTSLILDQVQSFTKRGLQVLYIKTKDLDDQLTLGKYQLLYMSPESLLAHRDLFACTTTCENLSGIIVDEAHLISKW